MVGYDEGTTDPTPLVRESDKATSRSVHAIIDLLATLVDAWQMLAPARFHEASRFARDLTLSCATIDKSPRRTSMLTAFGSARSYGLPPGLCGPASRLSSCARRVRRHRSVIRGLSPALKWPETGPQSRGAGRTGGGGPGRRIRPDDTDARHSLAAQGIEREHPLRWLTSDSQGRQW
jgi:hypothetical protein